MSAEQQARVTYEEAEQYASIGIGTVELATLVIDALRGKIAEMTAQLANHKDALVARTNELTAERASKFSEAGWFLPKDMVADNVGLSLDHLIAKAKQTSIVNVVVAPGQPYEITYEADWVKYLRKVEPQASQTWIVKLGSAVAHLHEPSLVNRVSALKQEEIIKRLMNDLGSPNSTSLALAFKQFANEICYGHVSLESVVQKVAGTYTGKLRVEEPVDTSHYNNPYAVPAEPGNRDTSSPVEREVDCAVCPQAACTPGCCGGWPKTEQLPVYSEEALRNPTNLQKATIMGLIGTEAQQAEAREFLKQHLAVVAGSPVAVDAYLKR